MSGMNYRLVLSCGHGVSTGHARWERSQIGQMRWCQTCEGGMQIVDKTSFRRGVPT